MGPAGLFRRSQRAWPWPLGRGAGRALGPAGAAGTRGGSAVQAGRREEGWKGRRARCWLSPPAGTCRESGPQRRPPLRGRDSWRTRWDPPLTCWCPARHANSPGWSWCSCERVQLREKTREGPGGAWRGNAGAGLGGVAARHRSARWVGHAAHAVPTASTPRAGLGPGVLPGSPEPLPTTPLRPWLDPVQAQVTGHVSLRGEVGGGTYSPLLCSSSAPKLPVALSPGLTSLFPVQG